MSGAEQEQGKDVGERQKFLRLGRAGWVRGPGISHWLTVLGPISWVGGQAGTVHPTARHLGVTPEPI